MTLTFYMLPSCYYTVMFCGSRQIVMYSVDTKGCWSPPHTDRSGGFPGAFRDPKCSFDPAWSGSGLCCWSWKFRCFRCQIKIFRGTLGESRRSRHKRKRQKLKWINAGSPPLLRCDSDGACLEYDLHNLHPGGRKLSVTVSFTPAGVEIFSECDCRGVSVLSDRNHVICWL